MDKVILRKFISSSSYCAEKALSGPGSFPSAYRWPGSHLCSHMAAPFSHLPFRAQSIPTLASHSLASVSVLPHRSSSREPTSHPMPLVLFFYLFLSDIWYFWPLLLFLKVFDFSDSRSDPSLTFLSLWLIVPSFCLLLNISKSSLVFSCTLWAIALTIF